MNNKLILTASKALMILFMVFGVVFTAIVWYQSGDITKENPLSVHPFIIGTYVVLIAAIALALLIPITGLAINFKKGMMMLLAVAGLIVLFLISYALASGTAADAKGLELFEKMNIGKLESKVIGGGLILTYILAGLAVVAVVVSSIMSAFKK